MILQSKLVCSTWYLLTLGYTWWLLHSQGWWRNQKGWYSLWMTSHLSFFSWILNVASSDCPTVWWHQTLHMVDFQDYSNWSSQYFFHSRHSTGTVSLPFHFDFSNKSKVSLDSRSREVDSTFWYAEQHIHMAEGKNIWLLFLETRKFIYILPISINLLMENI